MRPAVKEQVQSLGARFVEMPLETRRRGRQGRLRQGAGRVVLPRQREMMLKVVAASDVVITTALIPGKRAPILLTTEMVEAMAPGSVVVDLAAERGGNCELTQAGRSRRSPRRHDPRARRIRRRSCRITRARCIRRTSRRSSRTCSARTARSKPALPTRTPTTRSRARRC